MNSQAIAEIADKARWGLFEIGQIAVSNGTQGALEFLAKLGRAASNKRLSDYDDDSPMGITEADEQAPNSSMIMFLKTVERVADVLKSYVNMDSKMSESQQAVVGKMLRDLCANVAQRESRGFAYNELLPLATFINSCR